MSALYKTLKLGSAPRLLQLAAPAAASGQKRHLNLLEYQAKGLLQVGVMFGRCRLGMSAFRVEKSSIFFYMVLFF
jgi:hypothetical protein